MMFSQTIPKYRVSAIVSAYNSARFMADRLQNLIDQSLYRKKQLEIIVVDSCSRQHDAQIVSEFMRRFHHIVYVRTSARESVYGAWNRGIQLAEGEYIINANTDDRFAESALEKMSANLGAYNRLDAVYGDWLQTESENDRLDSDSPKALVSYPEYNPVLLFHGQTTSHAALIRKTVFEKIGLFNADFKIYGDREFMLRFAVNGLKAKKIPEVVGLYLKNPNGLESSGKETGDAEFTELLDRFLLPENFIKICGGIESTAPGTLSSRYVDAGNQGINFFKIDDQPVSNFGTAGVLFCKALEYDDSNTISFNNLGIIACLSGDPVRGIDLFKKAAKYACSNQRSDVEMNIDLAKVKIKSSTEYNWLTTGSTKNRKQKEITMKSPEKLYQEIQPLVENGWYDVALNAYERLLEAYPQYAVAHNDLGVICYNQGMKAKAQLHYEKAVEFQTENTTFQKKSGGFLLCRVGAC